jgi:hypothetical protein
MIIIPPLAIDRYELDKLLNVQFSILKKIQGNITSSF